MLAVTGIMFVAALTPAMGQRVKLQDHELPYLGGMREIALGPLPKRNSELGLFVNRGIGVAQDLGFDQKKPTNWIEMRVGHTGWYVSDGVVGNKIVKLVETDARYNQVLDHPAWGKLPLRNDQVRTWVIGDDGNLLRDTCKTTLSAGTWVMDAVFNKEDYTLTLTTPAGTSTKTITPGCGMEGLNAIFKPMIKDGIVLLREKEFWMLDPFSGGPIRHVAKVTDRFGGTWFSGLRYEGLCVEIVGPTRTVKAFISYEGDLMKVELEKQRYLHIEIKPDKDPTLRHTDFNVDNTAKVGG